MARSTRLPILTPVEQVANSPAETTGRCSPGSDGLLPRFSARGFGILVFLFPVLLAYPITLVGEFYIGEIVAACLLPLTLRYRTWAFENRWIRYLFLAGALWLIALVISDLWHATSQRDVIRGWGEIALMLLMLFTFRVLIGHNTARMMLALVGAVVGIIARLALFPNTAEASVPLSLGGAWALTLSLIVVVPRLPRPFDRVSIEMLLFGLAALFFVQGTRNAAGTAALTAAYLLMIRLWKRRARLSLNHRQLAFSACLLASLVVGVFVASSWAANSGVLGDGLQQKYVEQSSGSWGVLIGGRPDNVATAYAIADSPIVGHGSRPEGAVYQADALSFLRRYGYTVWEWRSDAIPSHSYVLGAWLSAGILALPFWLLVLGLAATSLGAAPRLSPPWIGLAAFLAIDLLWSWMFSPYGGAGRTMLALVLVVLVEAVERSSGATSQRWKREPPSSDSTASVRTAEHESVQSAAIDPGSLSFR